MCVFLGTYILRPYYAHLIFKSTVAMDNETNITDVLDIRLQAMSLVMYNIGMYITFYVYC